MAAATTFYQKLYRAVIIIVAFWLALLLTVIPLRWINESLQNQININTATMGKSYSQKIVVNTNSFFDSHFQKYVAKDHTLYRHNKLESQFRWRLNNFIKSRLIAFWYMIYYSLLRFYMFLSWVPYFLPIFVSFSVFGLVQRKIQQWQYKNISPLQHQLFYRIFHIVVSIALLIPFLPMAINPVFIPAGYFAFGISIYFVLATLNKRV